MPAVGRKPPEKPVRHRVKPVHDWTEVEAVPFKGAPSLPALLPDGGIWPQWTLDWWAVMSAMPHCILWDDSDWRFAVETAIVVAAFHAGDTKLATEIRNREKVLGTTMDFRRDLRIRYVEASAKDLPASVKAIDDYRKAVEE